MADDTNLANSPVHSAESPAPAETPDLSLSEHEATYATKGRFDRESPAAADSLGAEATSSATDATTAAGDERGPDGKFKPRHRAKSQQASPADVPRIQELTKRLREAEAERDALRRPAAAPAPRPQAAPAPTAPAPAASGPRLQAFIDQLKPDEDYNVAVERHAEAVANWTWQRREQAQQQQQAERAFAQTFAEKVNTAKTKYPDFEAVALQAASAIPQGSLVDRWIWEHKAGADVLYHFQKNPGELPSVLALPPLDQLEALTLLSQRLTSPAPSRSSAAVTGSATTQNLTPSPRPPNPVRTGPMRGGDEPPGDDASLAQHEQFYYGNSRRRP